MTYAMADIHGCYEEYRAALKQICFTDRDLLYVVGDVVDRGPEPMKLLLDMMGRPNVIPILGNHDMTAYLILRRLCTEITEDNYDKTLDAEFLETMKEWLTGGGQPTLDAFYRLSREEREAVLDYFGEFSLYEEVEAAGKRYLLLHGGLEPFVPGKAVGDYDILQILFSRVDYDRMYFQDRYTITGHTPTFNEAGNPGTIIRRNNHIAIDCGCAAGYQLAVFCLETQKEFYIPSSLERVTEKQQ